MLISNAGHANTIMTMTSKTHNNAAMTFSHRVPFGNKSSNSDIYPFKMDLIF